MNSKTKPLIDYNLILLASDAAVAMTAFLLGLWLTGWSGFIWGNFESAIGLIILSLASISFFPTYHLYNYHSLFSRQEHLKNLIKSFFWGTLTLANIVIIFNFSSLITDYYYIFLTTLLCSAIILLLLSRYFWDYFLNFLMALGLAVLFVGITGLTCKDGLPIFINDQFAISICFLLTLILLTVSRLFLVHTVFYKWLRRRFRKQIVIVGSCMETDTITQYIIDNNAPFWIAGTVGGLPDRKPSQNYSKEWLGNLDDLAGIVEKLEIDDIIITDTTIDKPNLFSILDYCTSAGINAWFSPELLPIIDIKLFHDNFCGLPMIMLCSQKNSWLFNKAKYCVDVLISLPLLLLLSPLLLYITLAIKLDSPGPVLYRFRAVGKRGKIFLMYKFRSMSVDSDSKIHKEYVSQLIKGEISQEKGDETPLKITNDPRVTKVGKVIRKFSLDELPQLINVLQGVMSLVGPRPCLPYEFEMYQEWYKKRTSVRPGITGLWQITGRSEVAFEDMILLDFYYIYNRSLALDFNILFETIFVVVEKKGAY